MRESCLEHNHRVGPTIVAHYPSIRKLSTEESAAVGELLTLRPKTKHVKEMIDKDPSASGGIVVNEDALEILYFQSGLMKQLFQKFPEISLVDATYNVNGVGMPLYCLMIEDGFGRGRVIDFCCDNRRGYSTPSENFPVV